MQLKCAVRPSTTSTSSSLRVKSGCTEGCTVSRALQVSSSAKRVGRGEQGRRQPVTPQRSPSSHHGCSRAYPTPSGG